MTAATQPRVPAGAPGGGRYAPKACRAAYEALDRLAHQVAEPVAPEERSSFIAVPAPRCPHGSFARWAARNCCATRPDATVTALGDAHPCTGARTDGGPCSRTTTRRDRTGRPACHDHGGLTP